MRNQIIGLLLLFSTSVTYAQKSVILIIADDLSPDYFGFYANHADTVHVPNIRNLMSKGILFTKAMSNPVCSATRSGILTGRYSFRTGVGGIVGGAGGSNQLDTSELTIPRLLQIHDSTIGKANIGKWHLHQPAPAFQLVYPNRMGYDHFEGPFIGQLPSFYNWTKFTNGISSNITTYATSENVNNAISWIKTQNTKPFFAWIAFNAPHEPLHLPPAGFYSNTSLTGSQQQINANPKAYFKSNLEALDHEIGRLIDSLTLMNRIDSTDFIFMGDNGNSPRTAQIQDTSKAKGTIYQYGIHVPFFISGPSVVNPGRTSDALINTVDVFATVLELFHDSLWKSQIPTNKPVDSQSLLPIIKNQTIQVRSWAFSELFKLITDSADGKIIRNLDYTFLRFDNGHEELYNISIDSLETNNLLAGSLTTTDLTNYTYLCNEMSNLLGSGAICMNSSGMGYSDTETNSPVLFPNPFYSHVCWAAKCDYDYCIMTDYFGHVIYAGSEIQYQDFSVLPAGIYFIEMINNKTRLSTTQKLIKN